MTSIVFRNPGEIDPRSITTFGISSKENASAIGFFGTGLKYAIAILLREGCDIALYSGKKRYKFTAKAQQVRVDSFDIVHMNGRPQSFTTELGKTWQLWQALRELYCNCTDEHGTITEEEGRPAPREGETTVVASGQKFLEVWADRSEIFLDREPLERHASVEIYGGQSKYVYYRGVRAYELQHASLFTYNILRKIDLTEDRTIKYNFEINGAILSGLVESDNDKILRDVLTAPRGTYEWSLDYSGRVPEKSFLDIVQELASSFSSLLSRSALDACRIWIMDQLHEKESAPLNPVDQKRLDKAADFCVRIGYDVREYPIVVSDHLGSSVLGKALDGKIYVSRRVFMMGTKMLAGTLMEEYIHLKHSLSDETRELQNFLVDAVITLGEQVTGEPL